MFLNHRASKSLAPVTFTYVIIEREKIKVEQQVHYLVSRYMYCFSYLGTFVLAARITVLEMHKYMDCILALLLLSIHHLIKNLHLEKN